MSRLNREKASALLPWNLPHAMSTEEWLDALEDCVEPVCDNLECDWRGTSHWSEHPCGRRIKEPHDITRDALYALAVEHHEGVLDSQQLVDGILALVQPAPPALDLGVVRRILTDALPADPKWAVWVEGRIEEIAAATPSTGVVLTPEQATLVRFALEYARDRAVLGDRDRGHMRSLASRLEEAL